jgi:hypothetical protein
MPTQVIQFRCIIQSVTCADLNFSDDPAAEHIIARSRIVDVGSSQALALARRHLEDCIHSHEHCFPPVEHAPLLPTRVVDCSDPNRPRLVATGGLRGSYTALSYVWGEAQPHSTTKANVNAYTDGIDSAHLSQTILDAIHTTRALGLQYLWVDSLCIIQDSEEDKLLEIARMGHIYRDTYVTIIAASAPRVSAGFLEARPPVPPADFPPDIDMPFVCPPASGPDGCGETCVGKVRISPVSLYTESDDTFDQWWDYFPKMEPVHERAWCMQEYAMSPRALVFASHTVQFHCRTGGIQNVGGSYNDHPDRDSLLPETFFLQETPSTVVHGSSVWRSVRHAWHFAVEDYTRRSLTNPEDKLVAFGGVAKAFQSGGDYLAGLWRDTLLSDLLWQKYADMDMERPKGYRAPSWSWAAVDGSVMPGKFFDGALRAGKPLAEIVQCEVDLKYIEHPFGEVTGGILVLRAPFEQCMWNIQTSNRLYRICEAPLENHLQPSDQARKEGSHQEWIGTGYIDSKDDEDVQNVWAVPVHRNADDSEVEGIIVAQASEGGPGIHKVVKYRRIGYFDSRDMAGSASWLDAVQVVEIAIV